MSKNRPFRAEDWWIGKASLLLGLVYLFSIKFKIDFDNFWLWASCSLVTISGFASVGYLINDYYDQEKDALAGKKNFLLGKTLASKAGYLIFAFFLLFSPWYFLPYDLFTIALIAAQLWAFILYSIPATRLKERGLLGLVADAMYAHAIPAVMAAYTYMLIAKQKADILFFVLLFSWQFLVGVRNVLLHQLRDLENDRQSKTNTFLRNNAQFTSRHFLLFIKVPELLLLILLIANLTLQNNLFAVSGVMLLLALVVNAFLRKTNAYRFYFPNILYDQWLPYSFIFILGYQDTCFLILVPIHALLFSGSFILALYSKIPWGDYRDLLKRIMLSLTVSLRLAVNWIVYIAFRTFLIDLRKENTDAMSYIRKKMNRGK